MLHAPSSSIFNPTSPHFRNGLTIDKLPDNSPGLHHVLYKHARCIRAFSTLPDRHHVKSTVNNFVAAAERTQRAAESLNHSPQIQSILHTSIPWLSAYQCLPPSSERYHCTCKQSWRGPIQPRETEELREPGESEPKAV